MQLGGEVATDVAAALGQRIGQGTLLVGTKDMILEGLAGPGIVDAHDAGSGVGLDGAKTCRAGIGQRPGIASQQVGQRPAAGGFPASDRQVVVGELVRNRASFGGAARLNGPEVAGIGFPGGTHGLCTLLPGLNARARQGGITESGGSKVTLFGACCGQLVLRRLEPEVDRRGKRIGAVQTGLCHWGLCRGKPVDFRLKGRPARGRLGIGGTTQTRDFGSEVVALGRDRVFQILLLGGDLLGERRLLGGVESGEIRLEGGNLLSEG